MLNKADLIAADETQSPMEIRTVATTGQGVEKLMDAIVESLVSFPAMGSPVPTTNRQVDLLRKLTEVGTIQEMSALLTELIG